MSTSSCGSLVTGDDCRDLVTGDGCGGRVTDDNCRASVSRMADSCEGTAVCDEREEGLSGTPSGGCYLVSGLLRRQIFLASDVAAAAVSARGVEGDSEQEDQTKQTQEFLRTASSNHGHS